MSYTEFICLDIETTGFSPVTDDAIEVAAVKFDITGKKLAEIDLLFSADAPLSALVINLTGIRPEDLSGKPKLSEAIDEIRAFVGDLPIVGHNISFDIDFLNAKGLNLTNPLLDTLELAQTILPAQSSYGLESLSHRFGFVDQPSHRAIDDVHANIQLFLLLANVAQSLPEDVKAQIIKLGSALPWDWRWLWDATLASGPVPSLTTETYFTDYLIGQLQAPAQAALAIAPANTTLIENHQSQDDLAAILLAAASTPPSLVVLPANWLRMADWERLGTKLGASIGIYQSLPSVFDPSLLERLRTTEQATPATAKLFIKLAIWQAHYQLDPAKLYLTSEEVYEWEQVLGSHDITEIALPATDIIITTAPSLPHIVNAQEYHLFSPHPFYLEDSLFDDGVRVFSIPYFSAAISSRREFVRREILPVQPRIADEMFKILAHLASNFTKLQNLFIEVYGANPPLNVFEKDIELTRELLGDKTRELVEKTTTDLERYLQKLLEAEIPEVDRAYTRTAKLHEHLAALRDMSTAYKYFLYAEASKFYLQLIPVSDGFSRLQNLFSGFKSVTLVSAGLSFMQSFSYWQNLLHAGVGKIITPPKNATLTLPTDLVSDDGISELLELLDSAWSAQKKVLICAGSGYDSHKLLELLHAQRPLWISRMNSHETVGLIDKIAAWLSADTASILVAPANWLEKGRAAVEQFDVTIVLKVAFDSGQRPLAKIFRSKHDGFSSFTLPRATMRFKEQLGWLARGNMPIILLDPRMEKKDYGTQILKSLDGFTVARTPLDDIKEQLA